MKAAVLTGLRKMEIQDLPKPQIQNNTDVLLKLERIGVCGSDVHYYLTGKIGSQVVKYPYLVGHECSATVEHVGTGVKNVKPGDEILVEPAVSCHQCEQCKMGRENTCYNLKFLGTPGEGDGYLREYMVMPEECCLPTRGRITLDQAALCEPFTIGFYTVQQSKLCKGQTAAILGAGPIGLSCLVAARAFGAADLYITDVLDYRVDFAKNAGATWAGNPEKENIVEAILTDRPLGVDVAYECAGRQETLDESVELLRPGGVLMLVGHPQFDRVSFLIDKIGRKEITIINIRRQNRCTEKAMDLVASGATEIDFMITHRFGLADARDAFELVAGYSDGVIKAMISP